MEPDFHTSQGQMMASLAFKFKSVHTSLWLLSGSLTPSLFAQNGFPHVTQDMAFSSPSALKKLPGTARQLAQNLTIRSSRVSS